MPTPFAYSDIWQHGEFVFKLAGVPIGQIGSRGQPIVPKIETRIVFKFRPRKQEPTVTGISTESRTDRYDCRVVSIDGNLENTKLPIGIEGVTGDGFLNGRSCRLSVKSIAQSSVAPIVSEILGESIYAEVSYTSIGGVNA